MPTASERSGSGGKGGAAISSNETPVSTKEQPNPTDGKPENSRPQHIDAGTQKRSSQRGSRMISQDKASGRDHPSESEHDHEHQKLDGESAKRVGGKAAP